MKLMPLLMVAAATGVHAGAPSKDRIYLSQTPLVMRLSKDEFRIAFGLNSEHCAASGCHGRIRYRVHWKTEDGATHSDVKEVSYAIAAHSGRSIAVDRQYFDTGEAQHTTEVVAVTVDEITCQSGERLQSL
ncbi:MAG: hypothetical protein JSS29_09010 [Proteobacteria bacterium]|nr:hypothetical protein [Pseudomonadota bacterium]